MSYIMLCLMFICLGFVVSSVCLSRVYYSTTIFGYLINYTVFRSGATSFFLSELERLNSQENKVAKVPLPPSFGYKVQ